jgi:hypothetical protein
VVLDQASDAVSGDAVAGSGVTGVVGAAGSDIVIQNFTSSEDATAQSGVAVAANVGLADAGPAALSGTGPATANQVGDNIGFVGQGAAAETGDAVAGSQVTGLVGATTSTVQGSNVASGPDATSANADAINLATGNFGPLADPGTTSQFGDNAVVSDQATFSSSGEGVAGSLVVGDWS